MLFNSYIFVLFFLPITLCGYYLLNIVNNQFGKFFLLIMSLWFYAYFNLSYLPIILLSVIINFLLNKLITRCSNHRAKLLILFCAITLNLSVLGYYKYYDFFISNVNTIFGSSFTLKNILLPLGISFFTFQQLSYVIDSYKGEVPDYSLLDYALFVTFFPQLIAGPIVTHDEIVPQFADPKNRTFNWVNFSKGMYGFSLGLAKKVLVADTFGNAVNWGYDNIASLDTTNALLVMLFYTFQIYFDFSGYCDMATGIGYMFNIELPMNFNSPYKALTIEDFWKRWHITLTRFFTRYVYIPLGGNRKGNIRTYINVFIVFLVSGLWHGANWTFILWGCLHGLFSILTRFFHKTFSRLHPALNWLITFSFVNVTWIYFRAPSIGVANNFLQKILRFDFQPINAALINSLMLPEIQYFIDYRQATWLSEHLAWLPIVACLLAVFALLALKNTNERLSIFQPKAVYSIQTILLTSWSILSFAGVSTFLYFNF